MYTKNDENNTKYDLFLKDLQDVNNFTKKLDVLFDIQFLELFSKILNMPRLDFTKKITSNISYILSEEYEPKITENNEYITLLYNCSIKYNKKYNEIILPLIEAFEKHEMNVETKNANSDYITNFRKHCYKTGKYAMHKCHKDYDEMGKFIPVYVNRKVKYVICELCRKVYVITRFKNYCEECRQIYYCNLLSTEENPNLLPATWNPPHCESIINKNIYCNKCKGIFYLNLTNNKLECTNRKCKNIVEPTRMQWSCPTCNDLFRSGAKVFNPSEVEHCKYLIKKALILKQKGEVDNEKVKQLEGKVEKENKYMWEKKKELDNLNANYQNGQQKMEEKKMQINVLQNNIENYQTMLQKQENESKSKEDASRRQMNRFNKMIRDNNIDLENTDIGYEIKLKNEKIKNDFLKRSISILASEIDEVRSILSNEMQDFKIPSRPISVKSDVSNHSQNESKQMSEA